MVEVSSSVELEAFEQIEAVPGRALLRIAAQIPPTLLDAGAVALNIGDEATSERLEQLPAPSDDSGMLLAAFSVPAAILDRSVSFELAFADGSVMALPAPTQGTRKLSRPQDRREAMAELEQQLAAERERRLQAESEVEQLEHARIEALARVVELEAEQHLAHDARAELARANADALEVARNFEREAAAREEAERLVEAGQVQGFEFEQLRAELDQVRSELLAAQAEADDASTLAVQWRAEAERATETAGRALAKAQSFRDGTKQAQAGRGVAEEAPAAAEPALDDATADPPEATEPDLERRLSAEREVAERQAINREVLRRAAREREQRARRSARRKLERPGPAPSDPSAPADTPGPPAARSAARSSAARASRTRPG